MGDMYGAYAAAGRGKALEKRRQEAIQQQQFAAQMAQKERMQIRQMQFEGEKAQFNQRNRFQELMYGANPELLIRKDVFDFRQKLAADKADAERLEADRIRGLDQGHDLKRDRLNDEREFKQEDMEHDRGRAEGQLDESMARNDELRTRSERYNYPHDVTRELDKLDRSIADARNPNGSLKDVDENARNRRLADLYDMQNGIMEGANTERNMKPPEFGQDRIINDPLTGDPVGVRRWQGRDPDTGEGIYGDIEDLPSSGPPQAEPMKPNERAARINEAADSILADAIRVRAANKPRFQDENEAHTPQHRQAATSAWELKYPEMTYAEAREKATEMIDGEVQAERERSDKAYADQQAGEDDRANNYKHATKYKSIMKKVLSDWYNSVHGRGFEENEGNAEAREIVAGLPRDLHPGSMTDEQAEEYMDADEYPVLHAAIMEREGLGEETRKWRAEAEAAEAEAAEGGEEAAEGGEEGGAPAEAEGEPAVEEDTPVEPPIADPYTGLEGWDDEAAGAAERDPGLDAGGMPIVPPETLGGSVDARLDASERNARNFADATAEGEDLAPPTHEKLSKPLVQAGEPWMNPHTPGKEYTGDWPAFRINSGRALGPDASQESIDAMLSYQRILAELPRVFDEKSGVYHSDWEELTPGQRARLAEYQLIMTSEGTMVTPPPSGPDPLAY
jgi:hypothetical protein